MSSRLCDSTCNVFIHLSCLSDLFESLVPVTVHQAMAAYDVRKSEIVNGEVSKLRDATNMLNRYGSYPLFYPSLPNPFPLSSNYTCHMVLLNKFTELSLFLLAVSLHLSTSLLLLRKVLVEGYLNH